MADKLPPERRAVLLRLDLEDVAFTDAVERFRQEVGGASLPRTAALTILIRDALRARGYLPGATPPAPTDEPPPAPPAAADKWSKWEEE